MTGPEGTIKKRAAELTADHLRDAILRGDIPAGGDLPGERELADQLGVSRLTLRAALARLEGEGLIRPVHGSGTRVLDYRENGGVDLLGYLARISLEGGRLPLRLLGDLLELRRMVAVESIQLITARATDEQVAALHHQVEAMRTSIGDAGGFIEEDLRFARLVVRATQNMALELLFNTIARVLEQQRSLEPAFMVNNDGTILVYERLLELVETRDVVRVRRTARRLLERLDRVTLQKIAALAGEDSEVRHEAV